MVNIESVIKVIVPCWSSKGLCVLHGKSYAGIFVNFDSGRSEMCWGVQLKNPPPYFTFKYSVTIISTSDVIYVNGFLFWSEIKWSEFLRDKSAMYIRVTLYWGYLIILWLFNLELSCTVVVLTCFVMCGCGYVWVCVCVGFVMRVCFGNMCTCIYCVLYCFVYVYLFLFVLSVLVYGLLLPTDNSIAVNNNNNNNRQNYPQQQSRHYNPW